MVEIVVCTTDMVGDIHAVVVIDRSALIAAADIFHYDMVEGLEALEMHLHANEDVAKRIEQYAVALTLVPFIPFAIAVEVHHKEL